MKWVKWDEVFKNGPNKICRRQLLRNLKGYGLLKQTISFQIFKGCLPQILLGPFLNTLSQIFYPNAGKHGAQKITSLGLTELPSKAASGNNTF